jgi:hypothetical protein
MLKVFLSINAVFSKVQQTSVKDCCKSFNEDVSGFSIVSFSVWLSGGGDFDGNVYAIDPVTMEPGPVCDSNWSQQDVSWRTFKQIILML